MSESSNNKKIQNATFFKITLVLIFFMSQKHKQNISEEIHAKLVSSLYILKKFSFNCQKKIGEQDQLKWDTWECLRYLKLEINEPISYLSYFRMKKCLPIYILLSKVKKIMFGSKKNSPIKYV